MENILTFEWFISVIVAGLLINLVTIYIKEFIEKRFNLFKEERRAKRKKRKQSEERILSKMVLSEAYRNSLSLSLNFTRHYTMVILFLGVVAGLVFYNGEADIISKILLATGEFFLVAAIIISLRIEQDIYFLFKEYYERQIEQEIPIEKK